jgi:hypothetical protein
LITKKLSENGFLHLLFIDFADRDCSISEDIIRGKNILWLGITSLEMGLTQDQVKELLPFLQKFAETGELR